MSEHDYWQVESSVYGGVGYAPATLEEYAAIAKALDDEAAGFAAIATAWESAALQLQSHRHSAPMCVTLQSGDPSAVVPGHVTAPYAALGNRCYDHATACQRLSDDLRGAADLLIRAHSLYSQAEMTARRMFTELLQAGTQAKPGYAAAGVAAVAAGGFLAGWTIDGKPNPAWMSTFTYPFQEECLAARAESLAAYLSARALRTPMRSTRLRGKSPISPARRKTSSKAIIWTCARCRRMRRCPRKRIGGRVNGESAQARRRAARQNRAEQRTRIWDHRHSTL